MWYVVGGVALLGGGYFLYRQYQASQQSSLASQLTGDITGIVGKASGVARQYARGVAQIPHGVVGALENFF